MTRARPTSIDEALKEPAVSLGDIAVITGLSYSTILSEVRGGYLRAKRRPWRRRAAYRVSREELTRYLRALGYKITTRSAA